MKKSSWIFLVIALLISAVLIWNSIEPTETSEEEAIMAVLAKGQSAVQKRNTKEALSIVSREYSDEAGFTYDTLKLQAIQAFRHREGNFSVVLENIDIEVENELAVANADLSISSVRNGALARLFSGPISIFLEKEDTRRWLVFRQKTWKVIEIRGFTEKFSVTL